MVGMGQLQFFSNLFFEIMGEGVHIHLTEIFPKLVSSDFLVLANAVFFSKLGVGENLPKLY